VFGNARHPHLRACFCFMLCHNQGNVAFDKAVFAVGCGQSDEKFKAV
jgi:hypothetical protein